MTISERIQELLSRTGLTQKALSAHIGVSASTMNGWLKLGRDIPAQYIIPICEFFGVPLEELLTNEQTKKMPSPSLKDDESEILDVYRQLDRRGQARMLTTGYDELDRLKGGQAATTAVSQNAG